MSADYSQIEMRVLAHLCQDSVLLGLFRHSEGYDIYRHLAARIFKKPVTDVAEDERTKAKVICLGKSYLHRAFGWCSCMSAASFHCSLQKLNNALRSIH